MLNASSGTFGDGSGGKRYNANTSCKWVIYPSTPAGSVTLHFNNFDTESNKDIIKIKGLSSVLVLATFSGNNIPQDFTLTGNQATLEWTTNHENELQGWEVSYTSSGVGINTIENIQNMIIYPNPTNDILNISMELNEIQNIKCEIFSMEGKLVYTELWNQLKDIVNKQLLLSNLKSGIYLLQLSNEKHEVSKQKIIVK
jgi:hypothetical protein